MQKLLSKLIFKSKALQKRVYNKIQREWIRLIWKNKYFLADKGLLSSYEKQFQKQVHRQSELFIQSDDIEQLSQKAMGSHARDYAFEQILNKKSYTFEYPYIAVDPYGFAPLTALILFHTKEQSKVRFTVSGKNGGASVSHETLFSKIHRVPVYGFYAGTINKLTLELINTLGEVIDSRKIKLYIKAVPKKIESLLQEKNFQRDTAYPMIYITGGSTPPFVFDNNCDIRYYTNIKTFNYGVFPLKNGRFLWGEAQIGVPTFANAHTCQIHEMDYMGRIHRTLFIEKGIHHFALELPNRNIVTISNTMDGCTEDSLIEIDRKTGKIVQTIDMKIFFGDKYRNMVDWVHPNSLEYNEAEDSMLVCLRNVHSVLKFRWSTKEIIWILSIPEFWSGSLVEEKVLRPKGRIFWNYQAHAAYELPRRKGQNPDIRSIMVFDNHRVNRRPCEQFNDLEFSYINVYAVNEKAFTAALEKQFEIPSSLIRSNAIYNIHKNRVFAMEGCLIKSEQYRGKILEMDYETGEVINSVSVKYDFFSGLEFQFDYQGHLTPIEYGGEYISDDLTPPERLKELPVMSNEPDETVVEDIIFREEFLYFKAKDHAVEKLYIIGTENAYVKDYTNTRQTNHFHENRIFYCVLSLRGMLPDEYFLAVQYKGQAYELKKKFKIMKGGR